MMFRRAAVALAISAVVQPAGAIDWKACCGDRASITPIAQPALTLEKVRLELDQDEPDYFALALAYGETALPHLRAIVAEDEPRLASKAAYLAGSIAGGASHEVVALAARSRHAVVRVAAAAATAALPARYSVPIVSQLLRDADPGVRVTAAESAGKIRAPALRAGLLEMAARDPEPYARKLAAEVARRIAPQE